MEEIMIEKNKSNLIKKLPWLFLVLAIVGGALFLVWFFSFYHRDSIDNFISEDVSFYSHWQTKKIDKNIPQIYEQLQANDKVQQILPNNFVKKIQNSSEFAVVYYKKQWVYIYKPINYSVFEKRLYQFEDYLFEADNYTNVIEIANNSKALSKNSTYKNQKRFDNSIINIYSNDFSNLDIWQNLADINLLPKYFFGKVYSKDSEIIIEAKTSKSSNSCLNNIENIDVPDYKYYINNISTKNELFSSIEFFQDIDSCVDIVILKNNQWSILLPNKIKKEIKQEISHYLAAKYPQKQAHMMPDGQRATHLIAKINDFEWEVENNNSYCGNETEIYQISEYKNFFLLRDAINSSDIAINPYQSNTNTQCNKNGIISKILINDSDSFIFDKISLGQLNSNTYICIH